MPDEPARPHLRVVDSDGQLAGEMCPDCLEKDMAIQRLTRSYEGTIRNLQADLDKQAALDPNARVIVEVLEFWRAAVMPRARIVPGSERWKKTKARLAERDVSGEQAYTPLHLKAAVRGALLSDYHVEHKYLDAVTIFRDSKTVDSHIARAVEFKQAYGVSALELGEQITAEGFRWLAERCSCGHTWLEHLRGGEAAQGGAQACSVQDCGCPMMDTWHAQVERFMREQE